MQAAPTVLAFDDRRTDGWYAVTQGAGRPLAWIAHGGWNATSFRIVTAGNRPLCTGRHRRFLSRWWDIHDADGVWIAAMQNSASGLHRKVYLVDRRILTIHGRWMSRHWTMTDAAGTLMATSVPTTSAWSWWHPDAWAVQVHDTSVSLAQLTGIVAAHRLIVKHSRNG